jgi:hypothetical protein
MKTKNNFEPMLITKRIDDGKLIHCVSLTLLAALIKAAKAWREADKDYALKSQGAAIRQFKLDQLRIIIDDLVRSEECHDPIQTMAD